MLQNSQLVDFAKQYFKTNISRELPSEWAEANRILTSDVTAFPGKVSFDRFPYWREPVNCLAPDHPMRLLTIMGGAQIGKSTNFIETGIGYIIKNYPGNIILTSADSELSEGQMVKKIDQMIEHSGLRNFIRPNTIKRKNKRTGDTSKMKEFPGGSLMAQSIKAVDKIRQNSFRYGFFDDFEAAVRAEKQAGDIIDLVLMRFNSFKDLMKVCFISTPEIKQNSLIEPAFLMGDQRYFFMPCPKCGAYIRYIWYEKDEATKEKVGVYFEKDNKGHLIENSVGYICQECHQFFKESHKYEMLNNGLWKPTAEPSRPDWFSYHVSALYTPPGFFDWAHHAQQWIKIFPTAGVVKKKSLQVFLNLVLGQTYEEQGKAPKINQLAQNTRPYKIGTVPTSLSEKDGNGKIIMLTCACDLNGKIDDARIDYEVIAHAETGCTYSIDAGSIGTFQRGLSEENRSRWTYRNNEKIDNVWDYFTKNILQKQYPGDNKKGYQIFIAGIDTGNFTAYANAFIDSMQFQPVPLMTIGIKGDKDRVRKIGADTETYHKSKERENLFLFEVNQLKDIVSERVEFAWSDDSGLSQPAGFMNFPEPEGGKYTYKGYFMQYESEQKVPKLNADGTEVGFTWQKKHSTVANHFWDCYDSITEVLTIDGWKLFKDIDYESELGTVNLITDNLEYQKPFTIIQKQYKGNVININTRKFSCVVTENHRMLVYKKKWNYDRKMEIIKEHPEIVLAKNLNYKDAVKLTCNWANTSDEYIVLPEYRSSQNILISPERKINSKIWSAFLGMYISEGYKTKNYNNKRKSFAHTVCVCQNIGVKFEKMKLIFDQLPFKYHINFRKNGNCIFVISQIQLYKAVENLGIDCYTKRTGEWIKKQSTEVINVFIDYAILGDGYINKNYGHRKYYTTSKLLADDIQELIIKTGNHSTINEVYPKPCKLHSAIGNEAHVQYHISINKTKVGHLRKSDNTKLFSTEQYEGMVYCASVKNTTLICRRKGKVFIAGNCAVYTPAIRDIFVEYFLKAGKFKEISWGKFCEVMKRT